MADTFSRRVALVRASKLVAGVAATAVVTSCSFSDRTLSQRLEDRPDLVDASEKLVEDFANAGLVYENLFAQGASDSALEAVRDELAENDLVSVIEIRSRLFLSISLGFMDCKSSLGRQAALNIIFDGSDFTPIAQNPSTETTASNEQVLLAEFGFGTDAEPNQLSVLATATSSLNELVDVSAQYLSKQLTRRFDREIICTYPTELGLAPAQRRLAQ